MIIPLAFVACGSDSKGSQSTAGSAAVSAAPLNGEPAGTKTFTGLARNHVDTPVEYPQTPPVGGNHSPVWQNCQYYDTSIPNERGVHSLEHGSVWITYSPDLSASDRQVLRDLAATGRSHPGVAIRRAAVASRGLGLGEAVAAAVGQRSRVEAVRRLLRERSADARARRDMPGQHQRNDLNAQSLVPKRSRVDHRGAGDRRPGS